MRILKYHLRKLKRASCSSTGSFWTSTIFWNRGSSRTGSKSGQSREPHEDAVAPGGRFEGIERPLLLAPPGEVGGEES
jgi:hypothetical protein